MVIWIFVLIKIKKLYKKELQNLILQLFLFFRGHERIRTAVAGFADQSLATRPRDH